MIWAKIVDSLGSCTSASLLALGLRLSPGVNRVEEWQGNPTHLLLSHVSSYYRTTLIRCGGASHHASVTFGYPVPLLELTASAIPTSWIPGVPRVILCHFSIRPNYQIRHPRSGRYSLCLQYLCQFSALMLVPQDHYELWVLYQCSGSHCLLSASNHSFQSTVTVGTFTHRGASFLTRSFVPTILLNQALFCLNCDFQELNLQPPPFF